MKLRVHVTMLINNAGIVSGKKLLNSADHMMSLTMDVNATAHFWTLKSFLPAMMQHNRGHIVTIASGAGLTGAAGLVDYCASKHAAVGLTESILMEIYQQNRNVNVTERLELVNKATKSFKSSKSSNPALLKLKRVFFF